VATKFEFLSVGNKAEESTDKVEEKTIKNFYNFILSSASVNGKCKRRGWSEVRQADKKLLLLCQISVREEKFKAAIVIYKFIT
jgi:hypothetical protein